MWTPTNAAEAVSAGRAYVRWLGHSYGVEYKEDGRTVVVPAEYGGDPIGDRPRVLLLGWVPGLKWDDGQPIGIEEANRILDQTREALCSIKIDGRITRPEAGPDGFRPLRRFSFWQRILLRFGRWPFDQ
jgi:hypothetical protein